MPFDHIVDQGFTRLSARFSRIFGRSMVLFLLRIGQAIRLVRHVLTPRFTHCRFPYFISDQYIRDWRPWILTAPVISLWSNVFVSNEARSSE